MDSYLEVTFLNQMLIMMLSLLIAYYVMFDHMSIQEMLLYSVIISLAGVLLWVRYASIVMILIELLCMFFLFRFHLKVYLLAYSLRLLLSFTCYVCFGGSFHLFIYFVPVDAYRILYFWFIGLLILVACVRKWKYYLARIQYVYPITLYSSNKKLRMHGYLDTGNLLTFHEVPIIFIAQKYYEYFQNENIELVVMNTMNKTDIIKVYAGSISLKGCAKQSVYLCFEKQQIIPMQCECLLNLHVLTR